MYRFHSVLKVIYHPWLFNFGVHEFICKAATLLGPTLLFERAWKGWEAGKRKIYYHLTKPSHATGTSSDQVPCKNSWREWKGSEASPIFLGRQGGRELRRLRNRPAVGPYLFLPLHNAWSSSGEREWESKGPATSLLLEPNGNLLSSLSKPSQREKVRD